ncbi:protein of unknown function [Burkholderia multivorans]
MMIFNIKMEFKIVFSIFHLRTFKNSTITFLLD